MPQCCNNKPTCCDDEGNNQFSLELDTPGTVEEESEARGGLFDAISDFFTGIIEWFKSIFENLFGKGEINAVGEVSYSRDINNSFQTIKKQKTSEVINLGGKQAYL